MDSVRWRPPGPPPGGGGTLVAKMEKASGAGGAGVEVNETHPGTRARCPPPASPIQQEASAPQPASGAGWPPAHSG